MSARGNVFIAVIVAATVTRMINVALTIAGRFNRDIVFLKNMI
jgi:hypothetical protein